MGRDAQLGRDKDEPESRQETARETGEGPDAGDSAAEDGPKPGEPAVERDPPPVGPEGD